MSKGKGRNGRKNGKGGKQDRKRGKSPSAKELRRKAIGDLSNTEFGRIFRDEIMPYIEKHELPGIPLPDLAAKYILHGDIRPYAIGLLPTVHCDCSALAPMLDRLDAEGLDADEVSVLTGDLEDYLEPVRIDKTPDEAPFADNGADFCEAFVSVDQRLRATGGMGLEYAGLADDGLPVVRTLPIHDAPFYPSPEYGHDDESLAILTSMMPYEVLRDLLLFATITGDHLRLPDFYGVTPTEGDMAGKSFGIDLDIASFDHHFLSRTQRARAGYAGFWVRNLETVMNLDDGVQDISICEEYLDHYSWYSDEYERMLEALEREVFTCGHAMSLSRSVPAFWPVAPECVYRIDRTAFGSWDEESIVQDINHWARRFEDDGWARVLMYEDAGDEDIDESVPESTFGKRLADAEEEYREFLASRDVNIRYVGRRRSDGRAVFYYTDGVDVDGPLLKDRVNLRDDDGNIIVMDSDFERDGLSDVIGDDKVELPNGGHIHLNAPNAAGLLGDAAAGGVDELDAEQLHGLLHDIGDPAGDYPGDEEMPYGPGDDDDYVDVPDYNVLLATEELLDALDEGPVSVKDLDKYLYRAHDVMPVVLDVDDAGDEHPEGKRD